MNTPRKTLVILLLALVPAAAQAGKKPEAVKPPRVESLLCNIAFLEQSFEPDEQMIRATLLKATALEHRVLFSQRFNRHLLGYAYTFLAAQPETGLSAGWTYDVAKSEIELHKSSYSGAYNHFLRETRALRAARRHYAADIAAITESIWNAVVNDWTKPGPLVTFKLYPEVDMNAFDSVQSMIQSIEGSPRLRSLQLELIQEIVVSVGDWGTDFIGYAKKPEEAIEEMDELIKKLLKDSETIPFPTSALKPATNTGAGASVLGERKLDYSLLRETFQNPDRDLSPAVTQLSTTFTVERELFVNDAAWKRLFDSARAWLRSPQDSLLKVRFIRAIAEAENLIDRETALLAEEQILLEQASAAMQSRHSADAVARQRHELSGTRLAALKTTLQSWMQKTGQARYSLFDLSAQFEAGSPVKGESFYESVFEKLQSGLELTAGAQAKTEKKGWFW